MTSHPAVSTRGEELESCGEEVAVEGEGAAQAMPAHQSERNAVCKTDLLVGEAGEKVQSRELVFAVGPQDGERLRTEKRAGSLRRERVRERPFALYWPRRGAAKNVSDLSAIAARDVPDIDEASILAA
jgi:hypothetical protein